MSARHRSLLIRGHFTDDEILDIVAVVQRIEKHRPQESFEVAVDDPAGTAEFFAALDARPVPKGYGRIRIQVPLGEEET
jgi:hypothetical protein